MGIKSYENMLHFMKYIDIINTQRSTKENINRMFKTNLYNKLMKENNNGITLIALVITIVVLIILASITINVLIGKNGIIERGKRAKELTVISQYKEKIEMIKIEAKFKYKSMEITLENLKNEFESDSQKYWVNIVEQVVDSGIEKIKLTTRDGYVFYITENTTEYRGKGQVAEIITAEEISYTPQDNTWKVDNVKQALDYLFNN